MSTIEAEFYAGDGKWKANKPGVCLNLPEQTGTNLVCITRLPEHKTHEFALSPTAGTDEASPISSIYSTRTLRLKLAFVSIDSLIDHQKQGLDLIILKDLPSAIEQPSRGS